MKTLPAWIKNYRVYNVEYYSVHHAACETFHFKSTLSNTDVCKPCPSFSNTSEIASGVCPCYDGYFRPTDGSEDDTACTREYMCTQHTCCRCIYVHIHVHACTQMAQYS